MARPQRQKPCQLEEEGRIMGSLKAVQDHFIPLITCLKLYDFALPESAKSWTHTLGFKLLLTSSLSLGGNTSAP